jgi:hypothetical protein
VLSTLGEADLITDGHDVWQWSSRENTVRHSTLPDKADHATPPAGPTGLPRTPQEAADLALAAIDPTTVVTAAGATRVAGRDAYELSVAPRDQASLISQVTIAIDATEHVPLRARVYARNVAEPAIEVAFTQVSFVRPGSEQFRFNPPPGAKVVEGSAKGPDAGAPKAKDSAPKDAKAPDATVVGKGWTAVLVARTGMAPADKAGPVDAAMLKALPKVRGAWGSGHLLAGKLFSVLLTDDGRVLAGAVGPERLYAVAADPAAALKGGR